MRTFVMIKPDGVRRGLIGECVKRFEKCGFSIVGLKTINVSRDMAERLYAVHQGKPFYPDLMDYITSGPITAMMVEIDLEAGECIKLVRKIVGATNPLDAEMGSIRGDFGSSIAQNIIHASDSKESAEYEYPIFFGVDELANYN